MFSRPTPYELSFIRLLTAAEVFGLQEFEPVLQFRVRYSRSLRLGAVIRHLHSLPPPRKSARAGKHRKALGLPIMIAYVPDSLLKCHPNRCFHRVMGATGSGKTSVSRREASYNDQEAHPSVAQFINLASRSNLRIGMNLESCTAEVQLADEFTLDGRSVILIDTPGFDDTSKSDTDILKMIAAFLATT